MWEHVPLAWALISLATSESTQQLPAEREIFSVKSRALRWVLVYCAKRRFYKLTLWANQTSCIKKKDKYAKFKCQRWLPSTLAGSRDREKETVNINRKANEVEHRGTNTKCWMFLCFHLRLAHNEPTAGSIPTLGRPSREKRFRWSKRRDVGAAFKSWSSLIDSWGTSPNIYTYICWYLN